MDSPDSLQKFFSQQAFQQISLCDCLDCAINWASPAYVVNTTMRASGNSQRIALIASIPLIIWHLQIHEHDIGVVISELLDGFAPVARLRDQLHIRLGPNQPGNAVTDNRVIVRRKYSNHVLTRPFQRNNRRRKRPC